ncbi:MAG TPA: hypothetical protein DCE81_00655 [Cytophagales bacterium]|nr:hypothetical protein [Cytophagales bacterium]
MNAGKWITVSFVLFAAFMATLVVICVREDVNLISRDYYQQELKHSEKMERQQNYLNLPQKPDIRFASGEVSLSLPFYNDITSGSIQIQRPSDARLDQTFQFQTPDTSEVQFQLRQWQPGLYRVSITFTMNGKEYHTEKLMVI